jgi:hypothetical protein
MKHFFILLVPLFFICIKSTAQQANDFYVAFSKSSTNDTLHIYVSVQKHQNISYEVIDLEVREKGAESFNKFQISNRFPYGVINDMNVYIYRIPLQISSGILYEVILNNKRLCNVGPFRIEEVFSSDNIRTFSYANPGYRSVQSVKVYNRML